MKIFALWTEHDYAGKEGHLMNESEPTSAMIHELKLGQVLTNSGGLVLRGIYPDYNIAKKELARLNNSTWADWLKAWKIQNEI